MYTLLLVCDRKKTILAEINKEHKEFNLQLIKEFICICSALLWFSTCSLCVYEWLGVLQDLAKEQTCSWENKHTRQGVLPPLWLFCSPQTERESNVLNNKVTLQHIHKSNAEEVEVGSEWWWVWYGSRQNTTAKAEHNCRGNVFWQIFLNYNSSLCVSICNVKAASVLVLV